MRQTAWILRCCALGGACVAVAVALVVGCGTFSGVNAPTDAGVASDGAATDAPVIDSPLGCAGHLGATFCSDFDKSDADVLFDGWDATTTTTGASLDSTQYLSSPRSLHSTTSGPTTGTVVGPGVQRDFTVNSSFSVDLDFRVDSLESGDGRLGLIKILPSAGGAAIDFYADTNSSYFQMVSDIDNNSVYSPNLQSPSVDAWHHLSISINIGTNSSTISGALDQISSWTNEPILAPMSPGVVLTLRVGAPSLFKTEEGHQVWTDNVVVNAQ